MTSSAPQSPGFLADGPPSDARAATAAARWGVLRRLEFIDFRLRWDGRLNRADLIDFFGISVPQASADIARYQSLAPDNLRYDRSDRVYLAGETFKPLFVASSPERFLNEALAVHSGVLERNASMVGWMPPLAVVPAPSRALDIDVLLAVLKSVRQRTALRVVYQSMSRPHPLERVIRPHALATDGQRWHVRAWCASRRAFRDFVLARLLRVVEVLPEPDEAGAPEQDAAWHHLVRLRLAPHPQLAPSHRRVIELDYGMTDGVVEVECRQALLFYLLKRLELAELAGARPPQRQVVLVNKDEMLSLLLEPR